MSDSYVPRPPVSPARPWSFPVPQLARLDNGLQVISYDTPGQHVASLRLAIAAPIAGEPRQIEGVGAMLARTLDEGTASHSSQQLAELLERKGVALSAVATERGLILHLDVPVRHLAPALDLLREVLVEPDFPTAEVDRHRQTRLAEIDQERAQPPTRAQLEFAAAFYQPSDRLSRPAGGAADTVAAIDRASLQQYHARTVHPNSASLAIAGHLAGVDIPELIAAHLGSGPWPAGAGPALDEPIPVRWGALSDERGSVVLVDRPGSVQSELYLGCPGPDRRVEGGWAPFPVLGFVVGGSPHARLDAVLREDKGFTYGMRSMFRPRAHGGQFLVSGSVRTPVTGEALGLTLEILQRAREGFSDEETQAGVDFVSKTAPSRYATADAVADEAITRAMEGSDTEETTRTLQDMATLTPARLTEAYRRYVDGQWTIIVVGDAAACEADLRQIAPGPVRVVPA